MILKIHINLKPTILDPQGEAISKSLKSLGFESIKSVRQGKIIEIDIDEMDKIKASAIAVEMCKKLLTNTVIEDFNVEIE
jgi:phosphoribosylformylglycinamidine synthase PurS subunit